MSGEKMLSILVCHSYFLSFDQKQRERGKPYPPLATLQVAAMLRNAGHRVFLFDSMLADGVEDYRDQLRAAQPQLVLFYEDTFNYLSKMCLGTMRSAACEMIGHARRSGARVIAAGPDVSDAPAPYLLAGADLTLAGEGLFALLNLLPRLEREPRLPPVDLAAGLPGVAYLAGDKPVVSAGSKTLPNSLYSGFAAWDLVDMERYRSVWMKRHGYFSLNMAASRGCSFRCAWCAKPTWGNEYLQRSPTDVALEMTYLKRRFAPDHIWFADDIFGFKVDWVTEFSSELEKAAGGVRFTIQTRADLLSERMAHALADAGCREAWLGAESGSQKVLDAMNKGTTVAEIIAARRRLEAAHIRVGFFIQLGYLGEELEDIQATRELLHTARPDEIGVSVSYPLPGTRFHDLVKAQLGDKTHWEESNDLDMMFHGTYTSDFYRQIRNLLHEEIVLQSVPVDSPLGTASIQNQEHARRLRAIERRWSELIAREAEFRSPTRRAAISGLRSCIK
jgi:anaerobic magnesium-protoporphyrin IX monomethyl ester cyclase